ncbi:hypothetical protein [Streptomyces sp. URMC 123]|uniref:hypothetical protein n=1 Tax=Streptomyces sp. URMC 123 TaxID=3423403 RepID=UPI003F1CE01C
MGSPAPTADSGEGTPRMLGIYLNDHLGGASAGVELAKRLAGRLRGSAAGPELERLAAEIAEDRGALLEMMARLEVPVRRYKILGGWAGEKLGRLKFNGRLLKRAQLSTLIELETLRLGVEGKSLLWRSLLEISERHEALDTERLQNLLRRAQRQIDTLESLRVNTAPTALAAS